MFKQFAPTITKLSIRHETPYTLNAICQSYSAAKASNTNQEKPSNETVKNDTTSETKTEDNKKTEDTTTTSTESEKPKETYDEREKQLKKAEIGYAFGANHWNLERASALLLVPLISTQVIYGPEPIVDGLLGVVLPYHIYLGFDSCITDYIPKRVYPRGYKAAMLSLKASFALTLWGIYEFNTNDIGMTEAIQRIWTA
ncbi:unnamed protein product [Cunninghamella echinulata]